jgi:hypothetical protein
MKLTNWMGSLGVLGALAMSSGQASASQPYRDIVKMKGWMGDCIVCHTGSIGEGGTAIQPFAQTLIKKGLKGGFMTATLDAALDQLGPTDDSDDDKVSDLDELMAGTNPNIANGGAVDPIEPVEYGCFNSIVGRRDLSASGVGVLAGLLTAAALWRTRRRST